MNITRDNSQELSRRGDKHGYQKLVKRKILIKLGLISYKRKKQIEPRSTTKRRR
jgi:hypothetical protein